MKFNFYLISLFSDVHFLFTLICIWEFHLQPGIYNKYFMSIWSNAWGAFLEICSAYKDAKRPQSNEDADCVSLQPSGSCTKNISHIWHWRIPQKGMQIRWLVMEKLNFALVNVENLSLISMILVLVNIAIGNFSWKIIH